MITIYEVKICVGRQFTFTIFLFFALSIPPIAAAVAVLILFPAQPKTIAYVAGTIGTLLGADLLNLRKLPKLGAPVANICGAGTFDGVFLSGIIAILLTGL